MGVSLLLVASMYAGIAAAQKYQYHVPWTCSVLHESGELVGACSILDVNNVLVSVDSLMERIRSARYKPRQYFVDLGELVVHAGTNYMNPTTKFSKLPANAQSRKVGRFFVALKSPKVTGSRKTGSWMVKTDPKEISVKVGFEFDAGGLAFGVGILVVRKPFISTPYVKPILIRSPDVQQSTGNYIREHEKRVDAPVDTCLTYSWNQKLNRIRYHKVMYLQRKNCRDVFCHWKIANCTVYPEEDNLRCFKVRP